MCGRYENTTTADMIAEHFELGDFYEWLAEFYKPRTEIFPGTNILAINNKYAPENIWWTIRDADWQGTMRDAINAKAETILKVAMFRNAFKSDRVLIPATALFEWQVQSDKSKLKHRIWFDEPLFAFAGVARDCEIKGETKRCGVILTTSPNEIFAEIHNTRQRQAVVIRTDDYAKWLDPKTSTEDLKAIMKPLPASETHFEIAGANSDQASLF